MKQSRILVRAGFAVVSLLAPHAAQAAGTVLATTNRGTVPSWVVAPAPSPALQPVVVPPLPALPHPSAAAAPSNVGLQGIQIPNLPAGISSLPWTIVILLTLLAFIPAILLSMTPFVRLLVVFHFLRQALGTQNIPTNQTLIGLSLFLTYFIMQPVGSSVYQEAILPLENGTVSAVGALEKGAEPARHFMLKYAREKDLGLFIDLAKEPRPRQPEDIPMRVVVPAYILSELKAGFQVGVVLFLPFLVVDMVVASITTSMGMLQLPPVVISTPLKLLLFVLVDGWNLVVGSLVKSFF